MDGVEKLKRRLMQIIVYLPFLYYYLGVVAFISYLLAGRAVFDRNSYWGWIFGICFALYVSLLLGTNGLFNGLYIVRYYWGFLLFYLIFRSGIQIDVEKLLLFLSILTVIEAVLINTVISVEMLPNYPPSGSMNHEIGAYHRPYGFGGSASASSLILAALLAVSKLGWKGKSLSVVAISACMSGSGFIGLFIYLLATISLRWYLLLVPLILGVMFSGGVYHISSDYISFLIDFKLSQLSDQLSLGHLLIGQPLDGSVEGPGGDFATLGFLLLNGLVGMSIFLIVLVVNINPKNWLPILIMLVGSFHYGAIFYLPGQFIFGYLLSYNSSTSSRDLSEVR